MSVQKFVNLSLIKSVYGVNRGRAMYICAKHGLAPLSARTEGFSSMFLHDLKKELETTFIVGRLLKKMLMVSFRLMLQQGSFKAQKFLLFAPVNGQKTRTNAKTAKRLHRALVSRIVR